MNTSKVTYKVSFTFWQGRFAWYARMLWTVFRWVLFDMKILCRECVSKIFQSYFDGCQTSSFGVCSTWYAVVHRPCINHYRCVCVRQSALSTFKIHKLLLKRRLVFYGFLVIHRLNFKVKQVIPSDNLLHCFQPVIAPSVLLVHWVVWHNGSAVTLLSCNRVPEKSSWFIGKHENPWRL